MVIILYYDTLGCELIVIIVTKYKGLSTVAILLEIFPFHFRPAGRENRG